MKKEYTIRLDAFEGPMDLLMHLIEKNKIDIYDIPIAELTEQYLDFLNRSKEFNIEIASEFIVMAATLIQIKSRMLLPKPPKPQEEEEDPRQELIERILEYRRFKEVSSLLGELQIAQAKYVSRAPGRLPVHHLPPENLQLADLARAFSQVLTMQLDKVQHPEVEVRPEEFTINGKMKDLLTMLNKAPNGRIRFEEAFVSSNREELITTFLAMLELIKLRSITVTQSYRYAEIYINLKA